MKTEQVKLLGFYIDENLNFADHVSNPRTRASRNVKVMVRLHNLIPCNTKLTLYKSAILPHLAYCLLWNFCKSFESRKSERVQRRALLVIYKLKTSET